MSSVHRASSSSSLLIGKKGLIRLLVLGVLLAAALAIVVGSSAKGAISRLISTPQKTQKEDKALLLKHYDIRLMDKSAVELQLAQSKSGFGFDQAVNFAVRQKTSIDSAFSRLQTERADADIKFSPMTGAVEQISSLKGLTGPSGASGESIVRNFLLCNREVYGLDSADVADLRFIGESDSPSGLRMVRMEQMINGRPIFQSETRFVMSKDGRLTNTLGNMIPDAAQSALPLEGLIAPEYALQATLDQLGITLSTDQMRAQRDAMDPQRTKINVDDSRVGRVADSKLVYFPLAPGVLVPAYSQVIFSTDADWYILVDARDGTLLWRKNIRNDVSTHQARFRVYVQGDGTTPADSPSPFSPTTASPGGGTQATAITPTIVSMLTAQDSTASPNGWINDCPVGGCTASETQTLGNNVLACVDLGSPANTCDTAAAGVLDGNGRPTGNPDSNSRNRDFLGTSPRDFQTNFLPPPQAGNPESGQTASGNGSSGTTAVDQFRRGSVTNMFYGANWYHDKLYNLGFNEAAGNYQQTNFSGMGSGGDRVNVDVADGSGTDNANFSTPPDGTSGRAQMYIFTGPTIPRDGGLDNEVFFHELTHGVSNRLIGNGTGLNWDVGAGMGEGWSDFYALSLLNNTAGGTTTDDPNGAYAAGGYATYKLLFPQISPAFVDNYVYGIRRFPYSTNNSVNPLTWADVDDVTNNLSGGIAPDPTGANFGGALEVHNVGEVWCMSLWEVRSRIIAANGANVATGSQKTLQLVTDAMKVTPTEPSFTEARDALLSADCTANVTCPNEQSIWDGFADRGLGYNSISPLRQEFARIAGHLGVAESFQSPYLDVQSVSVNDATGNNNGVPDPQEVVKITVTLKNPWRGAAKGVASATATLTTNTPGVIISDNSSTYGPIAAQGSAAGDTFQFRVPSNATCGQSLNFTITPTSSIGSTPVNFKLRVGTPAGNGAPITYTRSSVNLAIPDLAPRGVSDSQNITDDFEINDVNVRIDSLTHSFDGDLTAMIKGPTGYGTDIITLTGGATGGFNGVGGVNFTNTIIDDQAANDLFSATSGGAPYTGSWKPAFNGTGWDVVAPHDATGRLSRFNGTSTLGTWRLHVSDENGGDTGTLNGWSLIVTPKAFTCSIFTAANVSISGRVLSPNGRGFGNAVVTLTNQDGGVRQITTTGRGNFVFDDVPTGQTYVISVTSGQYSYSPQFVSPNDSVSGLVFSPQ